MKQILLASIFALFLSACGGGGGSSYTPPSLIEINEQNADAAVVTSLESMGIRAIGDIILPTSDSFAAKSTSMVTQYAKTVSTTLPSYAIESTDPIACPYDGNYTVSDDGTSVIFYECGIEENVTIDGTVKAIDDTTLEFIELTVIDLNDGIETYFSSAIISFTFDGFSVSITGYATDGVNRVDYERYTVTATNITETEANYTFNGYIKTNCLGGWIQIKTIQAIPIPTNDDCPTQGEISVIGNNSEVNVKINLDKSITITLNGVFYDTYTDCNSLPSVCIPT